MTQLKFIKKKKKIMTKNQFLKLLVGTLALIELNVAPPLDRECKIVSSKFCPSLPLTTQVEIKKKKKIEIDSIFMKIIKINNNVIKYLK